MKTAIVFGASGQIGDPLLDRLSASGWRVYAVSRRARSDSPGRHWLTGDLGHVEGLPASADAIFSCGPLDLFSHWYARAPVQAPRVVAFGSTSAETKSESGDDGERVVARRLQRAESRVFEAAATQGAGATLLRPTLVYGAGADRTLTRIAALAAQHGWCVLPRRANGLRQPVHVHDLAQAALDAVRASAARGNAYALPGGETLPYREMVQRVLATLSPPPRLVELPMPLFRHGLRLLQRRGIARGLSLDAVERMRRDLVFDAGPAARDFGYAPRDFQPAAAMFDAAPRD